MEQETNGKLTPELGKAVMSITPEEEAAIIAKIKAEYDPVAAEAEWREILAQRERGELVSFEEALKEMGINTGDEKELT